MGIFKSSDVRMALLEEKLNVYEELSKEMLAKLEVAVDKISESIQSISKITIRHEERIEKSLESNAALIKLIDTLEDKRKEDRHDVDTKLGTIDTKIDEIYKFRYLLVGGLVIVSLIVTVSSNVLSNIPITSMFQRQQLDSPQK